MRISGELTGENGPKYVGEAGGVGGENPEEGEGTSGAAREVAVGSAVSRRAWITTGSSVVVTVLVWWVISTVGGTQVGNGHQRLVPGPGDLASGFRLMGNYWPGGLGFKATDAGGQLTWPLAALATIYNSAISAYRMLLGLVVGLGTGIGLAVAASWSTTVRRVTSTPAHFARMMPLLAMLPLFELWFGPALLGVVLFVGFAIFVLTFAIASNAIAHVPTYYSDFARSLGAHEARAYLTVVVPAAMPAIGAGVLLAVGFGWSATIAAEFLGQTQGLGHVAQSASEFSENNVLLVVAIIAIVLAGLSYLVVQRLFHWLTRWAE